MFCYEFPIVYCTYSYNCVCVLDFFASLATGGYLANEKGKIEIKTCGLPRLCRSINSFDFHAGLMQRPLYRLIGLCVSNSQI